MERESISQVFDNWERFGAIGGALYVDGKMVAFTYGVPINVNTFDLCVEKGDINYKGVYTVVRHNFMQQIPEQYAYINLEEDLGLPGLRRAKSSYHPAYQIQKDRAVSYPELSIQRDELKRDGVRHLMLTVFNDSDKALDIFFSRVYNPVGNYCRCHEGQVVSAAQALPYRLLYHGHQADAVYLYAVGTLPEWRGQHLISRLFKYMHRGLLCQGKVFSTLLIEQEGLQEMYEKLGYAQVGRAPIQNENVVETALRPMTSGNGHAPACCCKTSATGKRCRSIAALTRPITLSSPITRGWCASSTFWRPCDCLPPPIPTSR